ncbi:MAG: hypothetical protein ACR2M5_10555 [Nakamurella sp.]
MANFDEQPWGLSVSGINTIQQLVDGHGRAQLTAWLRQNIATHDRLDVLDIVDANSQEPIGVLGLEISHRSSDAIARAGHPNGITPMTGTKVKFDSVGLIKEFNNGPSGAATNSCRIS